MSVLNTLFQLVPNTDGESEQSHGRVELKSVQLPLVQELEILLKISIDFIKMLRFISTRQKMRNT